jgi:hypothetical protein
MQRSTATAVVLATLPYLALKVTWLTGSTVGLRDPAFAAAPGVAAANAVTAGLDVLVVALAVALAGRAAHRVPAWALLPPLWIGIGLLVPTIALLGFTVVADGDADPLAGWVRPLVYGGFAVQGAGLALLAGLHAHARWPAAFSSPTPASVLPRTLARGAGPVLLAVGIGRIAGLTGFAVVVGLLLVAGAVGTLALTERGGGLVPAWVGTGTAVGWGLYGLLNQLAGTAFTDGDPVGGLLDLAQVLAGGVLWLALLTTLTDRVQARQDQVGPGSRTSASKQV